MQSLSGRSISIPQKPEAKAERSPAKIRYLIPTIDDVIAAVMKAGLKPEIERDKKHPSMWQSSSGRILVPKSGAKTATMKKIAKSLKTRGKI